MRSLVIERKQGDKVLLVKGKFFSSEHDYANYKTKKKINALNTAVKVFSSVCTVLIVAHFLKK